MSDNTEIGKNVTIVGSERSSYVHIDNKKKDSLILGKGPTLDTGYWLVQQQFSADH